MNAYEPNNTQIEKFKNPQNFALKTINVFKKPPIAVLWAQLPGRNKSQTTVSLVLGNSIYGHPKP